MSNRLAAYIRTYWPLLIGHLTALVVAYVATRFGFVLDSLIVYEILAVVLTGAVYAAGRWLENRGGDGALAVAARAVARWLLALGLDTGQPVYVQPEGKTSTSTWPPRP